MPFTPDGAEVALHALATSISQAALFDGNPRSGGTQLTEWVDCTLAADGNTLRTTSLLVLELTAPGITSRVGFRDEAGTLLYDAPMIGRRHAAGDAIRIKAGSLTINLDAGET